MPQLLHLLIFRVLPADPRVFADQANGLLAFGAQSLVFNPSIGKRVSLEEHAAETAKINPCLGLLENSSFAARRIPLSFIHEQWRKNIGGVPDAHPVRAGFR